MILIYHDYEIVKAKIKLIQAVEKNKGKSQEEIDAMCRDIVQGYLEDMKKTSMIRATILFIASITLISILIEIFIRGVL